MCVLCFSKKCNWFLGGTGKKSFVLTRSFIDARLMFFPNNFHIRRVPEVYHSIVSVMPEKNVVTPNGQMQRWFRLSSVSRAFKRLCRKLLDPLWKTTRNWEYSLLNLYRNEWDEMNLPCKHLSLSTASVVQTMICLFDQQGENKRKCLISFPFCLN